MKKLICCGFFVALIFWSISVVADCGEDCATSCQDKTGKDYSDCMEPCLKDCAKYDPPDVPEVPAPTPVEEPEKK